jgi:hypothetical protein
MCLQAYKSAQQPLTSSFVVDLFHFKNVHGGNSAKQLCPIIINDMSKIGIKIANIFFV